MPLFARIASLLARLLTRYGNVMLEMIGEPKTSEDRRTSDVTLKPQREAGKRS